MRASAKISILVIAHLLFFVEKAQTSLSYFRVTPVREVTPRPPLSLWAAQLCSCILTCSRLTGVPRGASYRNRWSTLGYLQREQLSNPISNPMAALPTSISWDPPNQTASDSALPMSSQMPVTSQTANGTDQPSDLRAWKLKREARLEESGRWEQLKPRGWRDRP